MITSEVYEELKEKFGPTASWTVWEEPANENWKSKDSISEMTPFKDPVELSGILNDNYIFVGFNPAQHDTDHIASDWENFHSGDARRSQDYKLRYALRDTPFWGSFITDIYPEIIDTDLSSAKRKINKKATDKSISNILSARKILGDKAVIVAVGRAAYDVLKDKLPDNIVLKKILHYSSYVNIDKYRETVLKQLGENYTENNMENMTVWNLCRENGSNNEDLCISLCEYIKRKNNCSQCPLYEKCKKYDDISKQEVVIYESLLDGKNHRTGDTVLFGHYPSDIHGAMKPVVWQVIAAEGEKVLLITKYGIDTIQYDDNRIPGENHATWEQCSLRKYMNSKMYDEMFSKEEQRLVMKTHLSNPDNEVFGTSGGNDTEDLLFLLNIDEVKKYFPEDNDRIVKITSYVKKKNIHLNDDEDAWWLRSTGADPRNAAYVDDEGAIYEAGFLSDYALNAVRPACWVDISKIDK